MTGRTRRRKHRSADKPQIPNTSQARSLADTAMAAAKAKFSAAALACIRGKPEAPALVRAALLEVDAARAALRAAAEQADPE